MARKVYDIAYGYGSKWHLLRYLGPHRQELNRQIEQEIRLRDPDFKLVDWMDFPFDATDPFLDGEWKGMDFLDGAVHGAARRGWSSHWPSRGHSWDAIARTRSARTHGYMLVEAKAHVTEAGCENARCKAEHPASLRLIRDTLAQTRDALGCDAGCDPDAWLGPYYQYANRLAALHYLHSRGVEARLLFIYFTGDSFAGDRCPESREEWERLVIDNTRRSLGLNRSTDLSQRVHELFLPVCPGARNHPLARRMTYTVQVPGSHPARSVPREKSPNPIDR